MGNIVLSDIRKFHKPVNTNDKLTLEPLNLSSVINYRLGGCQLILGSEQYENQSTIDNNSTEAIKNKLSFSIRNVQKIDEFSLLDLVVNDYSPDIFTRGDDKSSSGTPFYSGVMGDWELDNTANSQIKNNLEKPNTEIKQPQENVYGGVKSQPKGTVLEGNDRFNLLEANIRRTLGEFGVPTSLNALESSIRNQIQGQLMSTIYAKNVYRDNPSSLGSGISSLLGNVFQQTTIPTASLNP